MTRDKEGVASCGVTIHRGRGWSHHAQGQGGGVTMHRAGGWVYHAQGLGAGSPCTGKEGGVIMHG